MRCSGAAISVALVLFVNLALAQESGKGERLRLLQADSFRRTEINGQIVHQLAGDVIMQQGKTRIHCDLARQFPNLGKSMLLGHVRILDETQTLFADTVVVYEREGKQIALGHVVSITEDDTTASDKMTYFQSSRMLAAEGSVRIASKKERMTITGGMAEFWRQSDLGYIWAEPVLVNYDSLGLETSRIFADTMKIFDDGDSTVALGNVKITQKKSTATSGRAVYQKGREHVVLTESPQVQQRHREIKGDTLELFLSESELQRAYVFGKAMASSPADTLHAELQNKFTGASMDFFFEKGELQRIIVDNQATALYHIIEDGKYKGANEISGDRLEIDMVDGSVHRVFVTSNPDVAEGKYVPPR